MLAVSSTWAGVAVAPSVVEEAAGPGKVVRGVFYVRNDGPGRQVVEVEPEIWPPGSKGPAVRSWLKLRPGKLSLAPGEVGTVGYTVRVPSSAQGEVGAQVYFASSVTGGGAMPLRQRFGCALYVRVNGTEYYDLRLSSVTAHRREAETVFEIAMENRGNVHVRPAAVLEVPTTAGMAAVSLEGKAPIYPGTSRTFFARWKGDGRVLDKTQGTLRLSYGSSQGEREERVNFSLE